LTTLNAEYESSADSIDYIIVEQSRLAIERQRERLSKFRQVKWATVEELAENPISRVVLSNELVDAFPVHRARLFSGEIRNSL